MGESNRRRRNGGDVFKVEGVGVVLQRGHLHLEKVRHDTPQIFSRTRFHDAVDAWIDSSGPNDEFLVFVQRNDGRGASRRARDVAHLTDGVLPEILGEFHARRQCCHLQAHVTDEVGIEGVLAHQHAPTPPKIVTPRLKLQEVVGQGVVVVIDVPKEAIERGETAGMLRLLDGLVHSSAVLLSQSAFKVFVCLQGYDKDPREVYEIPEVRAWLGHVAQHAPWWPLLVHPSTYVVWFGALVPFVRHSEAGHGVLRLAFRDGGLENVMERCGPRITGLIHDLEIPTRQSALLMSNLFQSFTQWASSNGKFDSAAMSLTMQR